MGTCALSKSVDDGVGKDNHFSDEFVTCVHCDGPLLTSRRTVEAQEAAHSTKKKSSEGGRYAGGNDGQFGGRCNNIIQLDFMKSIVWKRSDFMRHVIEEETE